MPAGAPSHRHVGSGSLYYVLFLLSLNRIDAFFPQRMKSLHLAFARAGSEASPLLIWSLTIPCVK